MPKPTKTQHDKFKEAAHELGADDNENRFNEDLKRIAKTNRQTKERKKKKD